MHSFVLFLSFFESAPFMDSLSLLLSCLIIIMITFNVERRREGAGDRFLEVDEDAGREPDPLPG